MTSPKLAVKRPIVLSGIQPTGSLHVGNIIGAIDNWIELQKDHDCLFPIVDLHAITIRQNAEDLRRRCLDFAAEYIAAGVDTGRSAIFMQSHVSGHAELAWVLSCYVQFGELSRMTQFKDKSRRSDQAANAGLFTYPVLMAADILLYGSDLVPVGADQKQHLELARLIARRFNETHGETLKVPEVLTPKVGARIMKLTDPTSKMSKTDDIAQNYIAALDPPAVIRKKLQRAVTDNEARVAYDPERPGISNLMAIHSAISGESFEELERRFAGSGYGIFKNEVADVVIARLEGFQRKYTEIREDEEELRRMLEAGANRARSIARKTLTAVFERVGFVGRRLDQGQ